VRIRVALNKDWLGRWLPVAIWMAVIFFLSAQRTLLNVSQHWLEDLINSAGHLTEYSILSFLLARAYNGTRARIVIVVFVALLYALSDEWHQSFVPGRDASVIDLFVDALGTLIGSVIWTRRHKAVLPHDVTSNP